MDTERPSLLLTWTGHARATPRTLSCKAEERLTPFEPLDQAIPDSLILVSSNTGPVTSPLSSQLSLTEWELRVPMTKRKTIHTV
jgi:hypothetical protein